MRICLLALLVIAPGSASAQRNASPARGVSADSAAILAARQTYDDVLRAAASHQLVRTDTTITCKDDPGEGTKFGLERDSSRVVRRLTWAGGSEDHAEQLEYYYDALGRLRFAFAKRAAVDQTRQEERAYYDSAGRVVRRLSRATSGPGRTFGEIQAAATPSAFLRNWCR